MNTTTTHNTFVYLLFRIFFPIFDFICQQSETESPAKYYYYHSQVIMSMSTNI